MNCYEKEEKRRGKTELKIWNCMNIHRKRQKNHRIWGKLKKKEKRWGLTELKI